MSLDSQELKASMIDRITRAFEMYAPFSAALLLGALHYFGIIVVDNYREALSSSIEIAAIIIGFTTTIKTIVLSFSKRKGSLLYALKQRKQFELVMSYFTASIYTAFYMIISAFICFVWKELISLTIWIVSCSWATFACMRTFIIYSMMIKGLSSEKE